jgi:hypothetical protein
MLKLIVIEQNPAAAVAVTWFGVILLALVAVTIVGVWIVAAFRARELPEENAADPALEGLRRMRLVVRRAHKSRGPQAAVVSELEPAGEPEQTGAGAQLEGTPLGG